MMDGNGWMDGSGWAWGVLMMFVLLVAIVVVVWLVTRAAQSASPPGASADPHHQAREILAIRLAKGEIGVEEYQSRVEQLR